MIMAKTNKHKVLHLQRKIKLMAEEIEGLRIELSKMEEKYFELMTSPSQVHLRKFVEENADLFSDQIDVK